MATRADPPRRLVVAMSGASGAIYGLRLLEVLAQEFPSVETHAVVSAGARAAGRYELGPQFDGIDHLASVVHDERDLGAEISSGTYLTDGMIVAPCSIKTLSAVANSYNDTLIARAADVSLKERRRLVLVVRETPLHIGHLRLMTLASEAGGVILPPVPGFYHRPASIDDIVNHTVVKILDLFGLRTDRLIERWAGLTKDQHGS